MCTMKFVLRLILLAVILPAIAGHASSLSQKQQSAIAPSLAQQIESDADGEEYNVIVRLSDPVDAPSRLGLLAASASNLRDRYQQVESELRSMASGALPKLAGKSSVVRRFWISNIVEMHVDRTALLDLAGRDDVVMIAPNVSIELLNPVSIRDAVAASAGAGPNLNAIGARALWVRGLTGKGRLVASIDTGVEGIHPALSNNWRGARGDTAASWFDPLNGPAPVDNNGHGTHVMGIMVGRDGADTIGLAPDAEWICAAVVDRGRSLSATFSDILAALQWIVNPDGNSQTMDDVPDAVCNSWGVSQQIISPCDEIFFEAIDNVEAMGVVCVFAAGNEGPYTMSIRNPADRATSPTASFSVGAVDATNDAFAVPAFSSRGPSACDGAAKKPEIAAPGVSIRSSYKGQSYRFINGTSMAAPHVAAAVALLRQYNPELTPEQIKVALLSTAKDIDVPGEDNASGKGMIDLQSALASLPSPNYPVVTTGNLTINAGSDDVAALGESVELVVPVSAEVRAAGNVTLTLSSISPAASITFGSAYIGTVPVGGTVTNSGSPFLFEVSDDAIAGDTAWFEVQMSGEPLLTWWRDTIGVMVGVPANAKFATATDGGSSLTMSNFGHIGLGSGSALDAGGSGWLTSMVPANILHESALLVASADGGWSDALRRVNGVRYFDFVPRTASAGGVLSFDDSRSPNPVGVVIDQRVASVLRTAAYEATTIVWTVCNARGSKIDDLQLAWVTDIDLPGVGVIDEEIAIDPQSGGFYHIAPHNEFVAGVAPLSGSLAALNIFQHFGSKQILSNSTKQQSLHGFSSVPDGSGDYSTMLAANPVDLAAGDSVVIALAFIAGIDEGAFADAAGEAHDRWVVMSDVEDGQGGVRPPVDYVLDQNYPNPFNAGTTIPIQIAGDGSRSARLDIIDLLGRRVRTLLDEAAASGAHQIFWDGRNDDGAPVASGVYFARLAVDGCAQQVRSMVLLK